MLCWYRVPHLATRATLLSTEVLKSKGMFAEAAAQLIKMTSEVNIFHVSVKPAVVEPLVEKRDGKPLHGVGVSPSSHLWGSGGFTPGISGLKYACMGSGMC